jgi:hypothetical protein
MINLILSVVEILPYISFIRISGFNINSLAVCLKIIWHDNSRILKIRTCSIPQEKIKQLSEAQLYLINSFPFANIGDNEQLAIALA